MKKLTVIIVFVLSTIFCVNAQVKIKGNNWSVSPYVGILSGTSFSVDSLSMGGFTNVRIGAMGNYSPTKWLGFTTRAFFQGDGNGSFHGTTFNVDLKPIESLSFRIGSVATLNCLQRPDLISGAGQFETWTESQIPGPALGADVRWSFDGGDIGAGVYDRDGVEYQGRVSYKKLAISGSYNESGHWSTQASWTGDILYFTLVVQDTVIANISVVNIGSFSIYNDIGFYYQNDDNTMPRWECGLLYNFTHKKYPASGLFGLGYAHESKAVMGYLFLHLTPKSNDKIIL